MGTRCRKIHGVQGLFCVLQGDVMAQGVEYLLLPRREAMKKGHQVVEQCKRIEKRVFPKHEAMCDTFEHEISKSNTQMAYAKCGDEVVGYIVFVRDGDIGKIIKLCVSPAHRRKGIGAALLDKGLSSLGVPQQATGGFCTSHQPSHEADSAAPDEGGSRADESNTDNLIPLKPLQSDDAARVDDSKIGKKVGGGGGAGAGGGGGRVKEKGKKKLAPSDDAGPEANTPAAVQLQVDPERTGALNLYLSRGFTSVRTIENYYCEGRDALFCELRIS